MESVRQYGFVNAKVRAMRSAFLPETAFRSMAAMPSPREVLSYLSQTRYARMVDRLDVKTPETFERALFRGEIRELRLIQKFSKSNTRTVLDRLLERYEGERLKGLLRAWHAGEKDAAYVIREPILYAYPADAVLSSPDLESLAGRLAGTPFQDVLMRHVPGYGEKKTLFPIEVAVDQEVFGRLWKISAGLSRMDKGILRRLVGIEIDLKNLDWILRYRHYYSLPMADIGELLLPNGYAIGTAGIQKILTGGSVTEALLDLSRGAAIPLHADDEEGVSSGAMERFLYRLLLAEARKAFMAFPLSIGAVLGYATLMRIESRNLRTIVHGKSYGFAGAQIEPFLVM